MLASLVARIERLDQEIKDRNEDKSEVFKEARGLGFDPKILRRVIAIRRKDPSARTEEEALVELYMDALARAGERAERA